jgi:zinc transport system ATP-binding protein
MQIIEFSKIYKNFEGKTILEDISFVIDKGSIITIIGPNGAGKTTIAKLALGIEQPSSGKIIKKEKLVIGYVPQKLELNPNLPLDVKSFLEILSGKTYLSMNECNKALEESMLDIDVFQSVSILSGGQIQRLLIAAAILRKPDLLILDEPLQGLDINGQANFYNIIDSISRNYNAGILMISHDLFTVMKRSTEVICLNKHICCRGKSEDLIAQDKYLRVFGIEAQNIGIYKHAHDHSHNHS